MTENLQNIFLYIPSVLFLWASGLRAGVKHKTLINICKSKGQTKHKIQSIISNNTPNCNNNQAVNCDNDHFHYPQQHGDGQHQEYIIKYTKNHFQI